MTKKSPFSTIRLGKGSRDAATPPPAAYSDEARPPPAPSPPQLAVPASPPPVTAAPGGLAQPPRRSRRLAGFFALLVLVALGAWFIGSMRSQPPSAALNPTGQNVPASTPTPSAATVAGPTSTSQAPQTTPTTTTPPPDPNVAAAAELLRVRNADMGNVSLNARWILQVASKFDGVVDPLQTTASGSHQFTLADILVEHQQLRSRFQSQGIPTYLLKASDFGKSTTDRPDRIWVTIVDPGGISSAAAATDKCRRLFPELDASHLTDTCVGRTLSPPTS